MTDKAADGIGCSRTKLLQNICILLLNCIHTAYTNIYSIFLEGHPMFYIRILQSSYDEVLSGVAVVGALWEASAFSAAIPVAAAANNYNYGHS